MCTMKEVCKEIGMNYETLKFYCKEGLVPNVKRDKIIIVILMRKILPG